jgi:endo-1,4-beta-D-glucanase Y
MKTKQHMITRLLCLTLPALLMTGEATAQDLPSTPTFRGSGLVTNTYRNLFLEAGHTQEEIDRKLQDVFDDVFCSERKCYFEVGEDMAYISDIKNDDVRTEGMSYGLMIAVQWDRKDIFDRLWRWTKKYMQIAEGPMEGYFRWSCKRTGEANAQGPASDGELYFITSLIFASNQWGNDGEFNYLGEAQRILDAVQPREVTLPAREGGEPTRHTVSLIDSQTGLISFVPGLPFTDPSYHVPAFYEVWARYAEDGRSAYWQECAARSREYLHRSVHPSTGLTPDYNHFDGTLLQSGRLIGDAFRYDSWRVPMNIALDYSWSGADGEWQRQYGEKIQDFFYAQGLDSFVDQYNVDGTTPERLLRAGHYPEKLRHSIGLVATTAAASLLCDHPKRIEFIERLWDTPHVPDADGFFDAYYDGLLRLFAFMHLSGRYRVIEKRVDFIRQELGHEPFWKIDPNTPVKALPKQHLDKVQSTWPSGNIGVPPPPTTN